ncbi:MAG TPA: cysteine desulfurase family protein [Bacteroidales bacterium]|nr:cysteine desulfurase family protein [Bacteroidales bacterium]HQP16330.1 cysteine desulfurase family protein [Bacteroidales bacterium]
MIYLDNAATTPLDAEVAETMYRIIKDYYGNPSSSHATGRNSRVLIEESRSLIADLLGVKPSEIYFTSCATEAIATAIQGVVSACGIKKIITTAVEHHAVSHAIDNLVKSAAVQVSYVHIDKNAHLDLQHLEELLNEDEKSFVVIMHANNETGTLFPVQEISDICKEKRAIFFSDMVQSMGKFENRLSEHSPDITCCSAHKLHGPKGIGFLYLNSRVKIAPLICGGGQERNMRSGTENIYGIAGMAKSFEVAYRDMAKNREHISKLKSYFSDKLKLYFPELIFNAGCDHQGLFNILNISVPAAYNNNLLLEKLDMHQIAASGGSACNAGIVKPSHVLTALGADTDLPAIRFSFSKYNTIQELDHVLDILKEILIKK